MDQNIAQARKIWENIKKRKSQGTTILTKKREQELIEKIRGDRQRIWESKFAARS